MNLLLEKSKGVTSLCVLFAAMVLGCSNANKEGKPFSYRALNDKDTALLRYTLLEDNRFFGQYEVIYGQFRKDSGEIRGIISGDTLKGSFYYRSYGGGVLKRYPVAMLKRDHKWLLGKGIISIYMGIPSFLKTEPIDYSQPEFVFEEAKE